MHTCKDTDKQITPTFGFSKKAKWHKQEITLFLKATLRCWPDSFEPVLSDFSPEFGFSEVEGWSENKQLATGNQFWRKMRIHTVDGSEIRLTS